MAEDEKIIEMQIEFAVYEINCGKIEELAERLLKSFEEKNADETD